MGYYPFLLYKYLSLYLYINIINFAKIQKIRYKTNNFFVEFLNFLFNSFYPFVTPILKNSPSVSR